MTIIDWERIESEFSKMCDDLRGWRLVGEEAFERLRLSQQTFGLIKPFEWHERNYGKAIYVPKKKNTLIADITVGLASELGLEISPSLLPPHSMPSHDHFAAVKEAINKRAFSDEFMNSWGRLQRLHERYLILSSLADAEDMLVQNRLEGSSKSTEVQKYWYAHWVKQNASSLKARDRKEGALSLALLCSDIRRGILEPWPPYPKEWYDRLLTKSGDDLLEEYHKLGEAKLRELLQSDLIGPAALPPLNRQGFETAHPEGARAKRG